MRLARRSFLRLAAASLLTARTVRVWGQGNWPTRPVRIISPYGTGGANDISARILAEEFKRRLGQPFIVENKPGAGTRLANEAAARSAPDGYTFLYAAAPYTTVEALYGKLSYDPRKDLQPVVFCMVAPLFLIVNAQAPFKTVQELIAYGKAKPEGLTFGTPGGGSVPHLAGELLFREAGVKGLSVHYRGDATAYTDLLASRIDATLTAITAALPHVHSGRLRVLGVASEARSAVYPQAATLREQGLSNVVGYGWYGFMTPAGTPQPVIERMQAETNQVLSDAGVKQKMLAQGLDVRGGSSAEFAAFIEAETRKWSDVIRRSNIKGD